MKKITAGIFASLLTVVGMGAANADIASKAYVDDKDAAITTRVTAVEGDVTTIQGNITTINNNITDIKKVTDNVDETINNAIDNAINGEDGSVIADAIAGAISAEVTRSNAYADQAEKDAIAAAAAAGDAAYAPIATVKTANDNAAAITTLNADAETEGSVDYKIAQSKTSIDADVKAAADAAKAAQDDVGALEAVVNNETTGLAATKAIADGAASAAGTAQAAAEAAQKTADAAIPAPKPECANKGAKCVLTSGEGGYAWEVIARGTSENSGSAE